MNDLIDAESEHQEIDNDRLPYRHGTPYNRQAFGYSMLAINAVRIYKGAIPFHGVGWIAVPSADITLTSNPAYVCVRRKLFDNSVDYVQIAELPDLTDTTYDFIVLYSFTASNGVWVLEIDWRYCPNYALPIH